MIKSAGAWLYRWVLVFGLIKSFCGAKEDPPSAVGGLGRLMWVGLMCFLFVGRGLEDFLFIHLKSPWTAFHGSAVLRGIYKKTHPAQWGGAWKIICVYILKAHGLRSMGLGAVRYL